MAYVLSIESLYVIAGYVIPVGVVNWFIHILYLPAPWAIIGKNVGFISLAYFMLKKVMFKTSSIGLSIDQITFFHGLNREVVSRFRCNRTALQLGLLVNQTIEL